ncbi:MAG: DUF11 domain-containing protein [Myxococcales bacterium]|nr:DUF11 domain-containing protein [Myxococcales bacterium]
MPLASAPRMAVARDRYQTIAFANFNAAGIPDSTGAPWSSSSPDLLDETALIGGTASASDGALFDADGSPAYCHLTFTYYWANSQTLDMVRELRSWLNASPLTHVFAQAESARAIENSSAGRFLTTRGVMDDGATPFLVRSLSPGSPLAQYHGWLLGSVDVLDSIGLAPGSMFRAGTQRLLGNASSSSADQRLVLLSGPMDGDADNGNVTYLAGFDYGIDVPVSRNPWTNGVRLLLNSVLAAQCNLQAYQPQVRLLQDRPVAVAGNRLTFAVEYFNEGPASVGPTTLEVTLPAAATFVSASDGGAQQGDLVAWNFPSLPVGSSGQVSFTVEVAGPGQYVSAAKLRYHVGMTTKEVSNSQMLDYGEPRPPDTFFLGVPPVVTNQTDATFALGTGKGGVSFQCSLDAAPFSDCEATFTLTGLALGEHTLRARSVGVDGTSDPTPALFSWRVNGVPLARPRRAGSGRGRRRGRSRCARQR